MSLRRQSDGGVLLPDGVLHLEEEAAHQPLVEAEEALGKRVGRLVVLAS